MLTLNIEYLSYISQSALTVNSRLMKQYNEYADNYSNSETLDEASLQ